MKFSKPGPDVSKKTKASLVDKSKFKSKDAVASNNKLQKKAKLAADFIKKGSSVEEPELFTIKNDTRKMSNRKESKKPNSKPVKLSPGVKMGLKVDKLIEQKVREQDEIEASNRTAKGKNLNVLNNFSSSQSDTSPKKKKRNRGKKNKDGSPSPNAGSNVGQKNSNITTTSEAVPTKKARKRKGGSVTQSTETDSSPSKKDESESADVSSRPKKRSRKKKNKANQSPNDVAEIKKSNKVSQSPNDVNEIKKSKSNNQAVKPPKQISQTAFDSKDYTLNSKDVLKAVKAAIELYKKNMISKKKLLDSEPVPIILKLSFFIPHSRQKIIRCSLPHSLVTSTSDICLIVPDEPKKAADETKSQWEQTLRKEKVTNISEVIPFKSLLTDYKQYQDKRKLSARFDIFLADGRITNRVNGVFGSKYFHSQRKSPQPVKLEEGKMAENVQKALLKTVSRYLAAAEAFSIQVGHTAMNEKEVERNIMRVWEQYPVLFGVYWENIRQASLLIHEMPDLPIFCSLKPPIDAPRAYKNMQWSKNANAPVFGELSTAMDKNVLVYPSGEVKVKSAPKPPMSQEDLIAKKQNIREKKRQRRLRKKLGHTEEGEDDEELESDDDIGGRRDMLESDSEEDNVQESSSEDEEPRKKKHAGVLDLKKAASQSKGKAIASKTSDSDEDSDSDIVDKAESMYLKDLAVSKAGKNTRMKGNSQKSAADSGGLHSDSDEDDSDDSDADDVDSDESLPDLSAEDSDSEDEEEFMGKKPQRNYMKKKIQPKIENIKGGKKINGASVPPSKSQLKKAQNKPGALKSSTSQTNAAFKANKKTQNNPGALNNSPPQRPKNKKKSNLPSIPGTQENQIKTSTSSFQGVQANQKQKNKKKDQGFKNKKIAKKLAQ